MIVEQALYPLSHLPSPKPALSTPWTRSLSYPPPKVSLPWKDRALIGSYCLPFPLIHWPLYVSDNDLRLLITLLLQSAGVIGLCLLALPDLGTEWSLEPGDLLSQGAFLLCQGILGSLGLWVTQQS